MTQPTYVEITGANCTTTITGRLLSPYTTGTTLHSLCSGFPTRLLLYPGPHTLEITGSPGTYQLTLSNQ